MATVAEPELENIATEQRFLLHGIAWDDYEAMLKIVAHQRIRVTYDQGNLELMSPSLRHEEFGRLFDILLQAMAEELDFPCLGLRSTTWRRRLKERGIEADECYYLSNTPLILEKGKTIDLNIDPPPDLCIEIEISQSALDRMSVYAGLSIPEVWRFDGDHLRICVLQPTGLYRDAETSPALPFLSPSRILHLLKLAETIDHTQWGRQVRRWIRENLLPQHGPRDHAE